MKGFLNYKTPVQEKLDLHVYILLLSTSHHFYAVPRFILNWISTLFPRINKNQALPKPRSNYPFNGAKNSNHPLRVHPSDEFSRSFRTRFPEYRSNWPLLQNNEGTLEVVRSCETCSRPNTRARPRSGLHLCVKTRVREDTWSRACVWAVVEARTGLQV